MMKYKGYAASVEFDDSTETLHGKVINTGSYPIATFEALDAKQLRKAFERSVDEYLTWCAEDGVEPKKPYSGKLNLRLGSELHAAVASAAMTERVSINSWIVQILRRNTDLAGGVVER